MSIDQKELSLILGSEIVGAVPHADQAMINIPMHFNIQEALEKDQQKWFAKFKIELDKRCGFVLKPGAVKPEVMVEILEMYPNDVEESVKKFAESKGLVEIY